MEITRVYKRFLVKYDIAGDAGSAVAFQRNYLLCLLSSMRKIHSLLRYLLFLFSFFYNAKIKMNKTSFFSLLDSIFKKYMYSRSAMMCWFSICFKERHI